MRRTVEEQLMLKEIFIRLPFYYMLSLSQEDIEEMLAKGMAARKILKENLRGDTQTETQD
jgi:hypothetical protein